MLEFNDKTIIVCLPTKADDINGIKEEYLDANDDTRICIKRDGKWYEKVYRTVLVEYKSMLYKWYKGTGGGSGNSVMFQYWSEKMKDKYDVIVEV